MRAQLIVVQGKLEGKKIPLVGPVFRIGRGETCHLRPNSAQVSREHAEFLVADDSVSIRDLGSRNGTLVNGKALTKPLPLKDRDVVQVGPLLFAVAIVGEPGVEGIDPRLPSDLADLLSAHTSDVRGGDTVMIAAFKEPLAPAGPSEFSDDENDESYERLSEEDSETQEMSANELDPAGKTEPPRANSKRSSEGAAQILKKMMERRKAPK